MESIEVKQKASTCEERIFQGQQEKFKGMKNSSSKFFYTTIWIFNIFILVMTFLFMNGKEKISKFLPVFENMGFENLLLIIFIFLGIMILKSLPDYLKVFAKTKKRKFFICYSSNVFKEYYNCVTVGKKGDYAYTNEFSLGKVKNTHSVDISVSKNFIDKISFLCFSIVFMVIGAFSWVKYISIGLYLLALMCVVVNIAFVTFVIYFGKNKEEGVALVASFCKFLYNKKIIKDYEKLFQNIVDKLIVYNKSFKYNKIIIWTEIFANLLIYFMKGLVIYLLCYSINLVGSGALFQILFVFTVMQLLLNLWPFQNGTLIYELLFILLFKLYFFEGYLFWALLIYRVFDYFMYVVQYLIFSTILKFARKNSVMHS